LRIYKEQESNLILPEHDDDDDDDDDDEINISFTLYKNQCYILKHSIKTLAAHTEIFENI